MSYHRVIPRDLFNEADLLKCYARLWIELDEKSGRHKAELHHDGAAFRVEQDETSGAIYIANVELTIRGDTVGLYRPLNSRSKWPLWLGDTGGDDIRVFTDDGALSAEFLARIGSDREAA